MNYFSIEDIGLLGTLAIAVYFLLIFEARSFEASISRKQEPEEDQSSASTTSSLSQSQV